MNTMKTEIELAIAGICKELFKLDVEVTLTRPDEQFGDYATNVALQLAKQLKSPPAGGPAEIAKQIASKLTVVMSGQVASANVAGPGFLNIVLSDEALWQSSHQKVAAPFFGQTAVVEYSNPNPFKILHAGHLYTSIVGDAIANLLEIAGAIVHRVNFGGDVGLHVGKTMWSMLQSLGGEYPEKLNEIPKKDRSEWMTSNYIKGTAAYEDDEKAKSKIIQLNKQIYQISSDGDKDSALAQIYWTCRQWSYDYFDEFYEQLGIKFEKYYPESETSDIGLSKVKENIGKVFEQSDGAVIFDAKKYGLHTRVFINSQGLPTYEAKDVGLIFKKWQDYHFDRSIVITGNEQTQYMAVVLKAIEQFAPDLVKATTHLTHGMVKLTGGQKMSSRKGNILRALEILEAVRAATAVRQKKEDTDSALGAVKYSFLKQRLGGDIVFDIDESVALEGNSGPYLQYAHARARSILKKSDAVLGSKNQKPSLQAGERSLLRKITEYTDVVDRAVEELMPHHICTYLYETAQIFNRFYENNRVLGDTRQAIRLKLVLAYADVLKHGLGLLKIPAPEKM